MMNDISKLTPQQKSVMLARLCGWQWVNRLDMHQMIVDANGIMLCGGGFHTLNLYESHNMALAWRVLNWGAKKLYTVDEWANDIVFTTDTSAYNLWDLPPADAQRLWLDKVLELAIEAGMVTPNEETK